MAGHSQFKNRMYRKGAQDKKRAKIFAKLAREITVAARAGLPDPDMNPRLRSAIAAARAANMPNGNIDSAVKRGAGDSDGEDYEEIRYEGYGVGGVAVIVEALTDNRNRTASDVRAAFAKNGGVLAETNSVSFQFSRVGRIVYPADAASSEGMLEAAIEVGADDCVSDDLCHELVCPPDDFHDVRDALERRFGAPQSAALTWRPISTVAIDEDKAATLLRMIEALEESDDVQNVAANFDADDEIVEKLGA